MKSIYSVLFFSVSLVKAFVPNVFLNGPCGSELNLWSVPKSVAFKYIQRIQIQSIKDNDHRTICRELDDARELLRDSSNQELHVSFLTPKNTDENLFTVVYRMSDNFPKIYTIECLIRNHNSPSVSSMDMLTIIDQFVYDRRGHIQLYPLKTWSSGRYIIESNLEKSFTFK